MSFSAKQDGKSESVSWLEAVVLEAIEPDRPSSGGVGAVDVNGEKMSPFYNNVALLQSIVIEHGTRTTLAFEVGT